jgi:hypothetical protein
MLNLQGRQVSVESCLAIQKQNVYYPSKTTTWPASRHTYVYTIQNWMYSSPPVSTGDTFQDLPRMSETADSSKPYI